MDSKVNLFVHHHGDFSTNSPNCQYIGGTIDMIPQFDTDLLSFRDFEDFARDYKYNHDNLVYYQCDGHSFAEGVILVWDDNSVRELVSRCLPYGEIHLFVDHIHDTGTEEFKKVRYEENTDFEDFFNGGDEDDDEDEEDDPDFEHNDNSEFDESDFDSEDLRSECASSEDENKNIGYIGPPVKKKKRLKSRIYKPGIAERIKFYVGMQFVTMEEFRTVVRDYGISERRAIQLVTNDPNRCQVMCETGCPFYVWVSKLKESDAVEIRALRDDHLCTKPYQNRLASVKYLTEIYGDRLRKNPQWTIKDMIDTIRKDLEIEVPRIKILRVRKAALEGVHDILKEMYAKVREFGAEILKNNPLNRVNIRTTRLNDGDPNKFKRIYISYHALKQGWKLGCRPLIGLDGCFLKTVTGGQLLSAVGRDGNNQMFPLAYAVVESENADSWRWFIDLLGEDLELGDGSGYSIISDRQKGLEIAVREYLPHVEHRYCTRHICANFRKQLPSQLLRRAFWNAACATYPVAHQRAMKQIEKISKPAYDYLKRLDPKSWSKAYFQITPQVDNVENNLSECFNAWIINERYQPLLTMLQELHFKLMTRMREKKEEMLSRDWQICPRIKKKLDKTVSASRDWHATWDGEKRFVVKHGTRAATVDLEKKSCDCRMYDLTGIPCVHAVAAIHDRRLQPINFVSHYYNREKYLETYQLSLGALRGEDYWEMQDTEIILPPDIPKKMRGRPKKLRRKESWEEGSRGSQTAVNSSQVPTMQRLNTRRKMHCSICRDPSHRKTKCPLRPRNENENDEQQDEDFGTGDATQEEGSENATQQDGSENATQQEGNENATQQEGWRYRNKLHVRRKKQSMEEIV